MNDNKNQDIIICLNVTLKDTSINNKETFSLDSSLGPKDTKFHTIPYV